MAEKNKIYKFYSQGAHFRVTITKPEVRVQPDTNRRIEVGGEIANFAPDGRYETSDAETAKTLRAAGSFGVYFWEDEAGADASPTEQEVTDRLLALAAAQDVAGVEDLLTTEKTGHNRTAIVGRIESTLANVKAIRDANEHNPGAGIVEAADKDAAEAKATAATKKAAAAKKADTDEG